MQRISISMKLYFGLAITRYSSQAESKMTAFRYILLVIQKHLDSGGIAEIHKILEVMYS